jgi:hypothetical protein
MTVHMSEAVSTANQQAATARRRGRLVPLLFACWTALAVAAIWWLVSDAANSGNTVIRIGQGEAKTWSTRLHDNVALARLNFPWALAWLFLVPYVLWIGVRFSFDSTRWRSRLLVLLLTGAGFIWGSQWLSRRLGSGGATIVMVRYTADETVQKLHSPVGESGEPSQPVSTTNRLVTNRFTKIMVSSESGRATNRASWEMMTSEILSGLTNHLPPLIAGGAAGGASGFLPPAGPIHLRRWSAALDGLAFIALIGLAHAGVFYRRYREREQQASLLESRLNEARLRALQAQLQPHFLFNTLNGIATLLRRDPAKAEEMLLSLSELLRISLGSSQRQEIPLREEMDFLGRYLAIQRMRFGDRLQVSEEIEPATQDCLVPALLLQPLVENAIRHGLEPSGRPGKLRIAASREGEWLKLTIEDNGVGLPPSDHHRAGVGLANVRERLSTLHNGTHQFEMAERPEGGVVVNIRLPARVGKASEPANLGVNS